MNLLLEGILARAAAMYDVTICHYIFMANHFHLIGVIGDPSEAPAFMRYVKGEIAHAINRLLGRRGRTVWSEGYDSPIILTADTVLDRMLYLYLNPARADLETSVAKYPLTNSYAFLINQRRSLSSRKVARDTIPPLKAAAMSSKDQESFSARLRRGKGTDEILTVKPWAWLQCFAKSTHLNPDTMREAFLKRLHFVERQLALIRHRPVVGAHALRLQSHIRAHTPAKHGKKMVCLSSDVTLRIHFIHWFQHQSTLASRAFHSWKQGIRRAHPPPGFFTTGGFQFSCLLSWSL